MPRKPLVEEALKVLVEEALSLSTGFAIAALVLLAGKYNPLEVLGIMFSEGFRNFDVLVKQSIPVISTGLAFSIPALAGLFNIGGESQLYMGAFTGLVSTYLVYNSLGQPLLASLTGLAVGTLAGGLWGFIIGYLRAHKNVNEVVIAIMMNWSTYYLILHLIVSKFTDPIYSHMSIFVPPPSRIPSTVGFILIVAVAVLTYLLLKHTELGYSIRVAGLNPRATVYAGFDPRRISIMAMSLAGAVAGLGGALFVISAIYSIDTTMSALYGLGFLGIGIGLLGRNNPIGIILAGLFISGLQFGGQWVELRTGAPPYLTDVAIGVVVIALSATYAYQFLSSMMLRRRGVEQ